MMCAYVRIVNAAVVTYFFFIMMVCSWQDTKTRKNPDMVVSNVRIPYCCICLMGDISKY